MDHSEVVLVTGYKPYELGIFTADHQGIPVIRYCLKKQIRRLADEGTTWFVISGQAGVELWAGDACLEVKKEDGLDIKLAVLVPFLNQEVRYKDWLKEQYYRIIEAADFTGAISRRPYESPVQLRQKNDYLVAKTDGALVLYDEETPGSPKYCLAAAKRKAGNEDYPIRMIDRYDLSSAAEELQQQNPDYWSQM
ncbi:MULTISPECIES: DUF1273 domain-containing protein [unclassified Sporolactobacillus]|uniref:DUF1273 domain-containing protein n=1 Tax=unclassified Sporolactobacillus TaxID=2628533 RepID=UPI0023683807|nr:DUF1273 domain-containing protein [Sporolactobacillus sp. CQH2019]MDD9148770.1 DUF1273 domain-containing protein [Sporolactobacillus sp. CQH2019]